MTLQKLDYTSRIPDGMMFKKYPIDNRSWTAQRLLQQPRGCWMVSFYMHLLSEGNQSPGNSAMFWEVEIQNIVRRKDIRSDF
jgi:hypothetical protein